jgi:hypothetical protein
MLRLHDVRRLSEPRGASDPGRATARENARATRIRGVGHLRISQAENKREGIVDGPLLLG